MLRSSLWIWGSSYACRGITNRPAANVAQPNGVCTSPACDGSARGGHDEQSLAGKQSGRDRAASRNIATSSARDRCDGKTESGSAGEPVISVHSASDNPQATLPAATRTSEHSSQRDRRLRGIQNSLKIRLHPFHDRRCCDTNGFDRTPAVSHPMQPRLPGADADLRDLRPTAPAADPVNGAVRQDERVA